MTIHSCSVFFTLCCHSQTRSREVEGSPEHSYVLSDACVLSLFFAAGKLPVGIGAAAALAAVAVIVDAGGQRVRTPTGREYLPFPRQNPDL